jgi:hypothetical protein
MGSLLYTSDPGATSLEKFGIAQADIAKCEVGAAEVLRVPYDRRSAFLRLGPPQVVRASLFFAFRQTSG